MNGQTLEHPEGRDREPQHCPKCGQFGHLQYHVIMGYKYQLSKYLCGTCGEFLKQLEVVE